MPFSGYVVPDFRVSRRVERISERGDLGWEWWKDRKGLTWSIFELELQMEVTKFKY